MPKKPKVLVLSRDISTNQLKPKRLRVSIACLVCRKKKRKCDGISPCSFCKKNMLTCQFSYVSTNCTNSATISSKNIIVDKSASKSPNFHGGNENITTLPIDTVNYGHEHSNEATNKVCNRDSNENQEIFDQSFQSDSKEIIINPSRLNIDYKRIVETIFTEEALAKIIVRNQVSCREHKKDGQCSDQNNNNYDINEYIIKLIKKNTDNNNCLNLLGLRMQTHSILPPREVALKLILKTWNYACVLFRFYHRPTIIKILDSLYENIEFPKTLIDVKAEALIYSVLAVGALFSRDDYHEHDTINREYYRDEGLKFFLHAKRLIDFADVSDIYSIQTVFMLTIFLQCSANLKSCYYYIGIALRSVIKEGLYKKTSLVGPTPIEDETKKRLFWSIYKVDIYMNCILGLPSSLSIDKIDQLLPMDIDDERITSNGISPDVSTHDDILNNSIGDNSNARTTVNDNDSTSYSNPNTNVSITKISSCGMNNEHTKLLLIMSSIYDYTSQLTLSKILQKKELFKNMNRLELELSRWFKNLPNSLKPEYEKLLNSEQMAIYLKPQKLLYLDFLLTKLTLFKPFFHFITLDIREYPNLEFQIKMSQNCIKVSIEIIRLSYHMINDKLLNGTYWYSIHTIYYSFACLTIYKYQLLEKRRAHLDKMTTEKGYGSIDILRQSAKNDTADDYKLKEIEEVYDIGYKILVELQDFSNAGKRILKVLELIFKQFNEKFLEMNRQLINNLETIKHKENFNRTANIKNSNFGNISNHTSMDGNHLQNAQAFSFLNSTVLPEGESKYRPPNMYDLINEHHINHSDDDHSNDTNSNSKSPYSSLNHNIDDTGISNSTGTINSKISDNIQPQNETNPESTVERATTSNSPYLEDKNYTSFNNGVYETASPKRKTNYSGLNDSTVHNTVNHSALDVSKITKGHSNNTDANMNSSINTIDNPETNLIFNSQNFLNKLLEELEEELKTNAA